MTGLTLTVEASGANSEGQDIGWYTSAFAIPVHLNAFVPPGQLVQVHGQRGVHVHPDTWAEMKAELKDSLRRQRQEELFEPDQDSPRDAPPEGYGRPMNEAFEIAGMIWEMKQRLKDLTP